jgi:hypothetical protein
MKTKIIIGTLMLIFLSIHSNAQSSENMIKEVLEGFCQNYYGECFSGRKYIHNTLTVGKVEERENNTIKVTGTHSYRGSYGSLYEYMEYYVYITVNSNNITFEFHKRAKADYFHSTDYWEECSRTVSK